MKANYRHILFVLFQILFLQSWAQLTMPTNQVSLQQNSGFTLYYEFNNDAQTVRFGLDINQNVDYFAIGFADSSRFGMSGFDIAAVIFTASTANPGQYNARIQDSWATQNGAPPSDLSLGGTADYTLVDSYAVEGRRQVIFERRYNTGDQWDYTFAESQNGVNIAISWAWLSNGRATLAYHGGANRGTILAPLTYPQPEEEETPVEETPEETSEETSPVEQTPEQPSAEETPEESPVEENNPSENNEDSEEVVVYEPIESITPLDFPNKKFNFSADLSFYYEFVESTKTVRMGLEINKNVDYFAVGFSDANNWGMNNFDIAAFIFRPSASALSGISVDAWDLYSTGTSQPPRDSSLGGTTDYKVLEYYIGDNRRQVLFERAYDTKDAFDYKFDPSTGVKTAVSWAWSMVGVSSLSYHQGNRGTNLLQMYPIKQDEPTTPDGNSPGGNSANPLRSDKPLVFPPSQVTIEDAGMVIYFDFNDAKKMITMGLEIQRPIDFFAVGFADEGNSGMNNFDIVAFVFSRTQNDINVNTMDLYSTENSRPPSDTALGGSNDYKLLSFYADGDRSQVLFERAYDTGDAFDYKFEPSNPYKNIAVNWAWLINGAGVMDYHGRQNRGTILTPMFNGLVGSGKDYHSGINPDLFYKFHGYLFLAMWGILIDVAIWIARYRKYSKFHVALHLTLTGIIYLSTVVLTAIALKLRSNGGGMEGTLYDAHLALGILTLILSTLQMLGGFIFRHKMVSTTVTKSLPRLTLMHKLLGITTYIIAKAQLLIGLDIYRPNYIGILIAVYVLLFVFWVAHGYFSKFGDLYIRRNAKIIPDSQSKSEKHKTLMTLLNNKTPIDQILENPELKDLKWCILDGQVFQINGFNHPGGNFIINQINGREIGRFIYGVVGLESFNAQSKHAHTSQAYTYIRKNHIGAIQTNYNLFVPKYFKQPDPDRQLPLKVAQTWTLLQKISLSEHTSKFVFKSDRFEVHEWSHDIRDLGKHLRVSHVTHSKVRLYTLVLSQTNGRTQRRNLILDRDSKSAQLAETLSKKSSVKTIPIIVKNYNVPAENTFSSFLHNCPENTEGFSIQGPFGTGFGLTLESTGTHYIFAAGTGILPFLDLFDFLLESVLDPTHEKNNIFHNGFKLRIFASFRTIDDFVGLDIIENLIKACREAGLDDAVEMIIRCNDAKGSQLFTVSYENFDREFINKNVNTDGEKVFVCGPPTFNNSVPSELQILGIPMSKIMLV